MEQVVDNEQESLLVARLEAFGASLIKRRDEAVQARKASGIEDEWTDAEEAYQGIDDANRGQRVVSGKPSGANGGYINGPVKNSPRSTVYLNITRPYVDAAAARVGDMLLPTDDSPWSIKPTPIPSSLSEMQVAIEQVIDQSKAAAEGATRQIEDWLIECQWHAEVRKMIEDCARLGTGILKGPFPVKRVSRRTMSEGGLIGFASVTEIKPASKCINPWNFFPDGSCGEDIHDGGYCWERDTLSGRALRDLKGLPGYIDSQIDRALEMGPQGKLLEKGLVHDRVKPSDKDSFEVWYYYGMADREDLEAAGVELPEFGDISTPCMVTVVNDLVIRANLSPLDSGEFPFDVMPWQRKTGMPWGTGVAMQINTPQRMINAGGRNLMDNASLSAGPQLVIRKGAIVPADGSYVITPRKLWYANEGADVNAVQQAFMAINIPTMQAEMLNIIQFASKMAEDVTGLPMLMQGQQGTAPETVGGMQMLNNNASVVLRRIARLFDDKVTEPHIRRYYEWLMTYGENEEIKGDFQIDARGSTALVERDLQNQAIIQMGQFAANPAFGVDPEKWFSEMLKSQRLDPARFLLDEEKRAQLAQQPPPVAPVVQAAQIRSETDLQKTQMTLAAKAQSDQLEAQVDMSRAQSEYDRDLTYVQSENQRTALEHQARMEELALRRELEMLRYATQQNVSLERVKADLAKKAMDINSTKELVGLNAKAAQLPKPPVEPPGLAPDGRSFTQ